MLHAHKAIAFSRYNEMSMWRIKRIYEQPDVADGTRVLVDRLWPRGVSKVEAALDLWLKDVAPTPELRKWFNHDPEKFVQFSHRYMDELAQNSAVATLERLGKESGTVTLLYGAKDPAVNHAVVLCQFLELKTKLPVKD